ncbi:unnamed protein product [Arabidopsis halleri]
MLLSVLFLLVEKRSCRFIQRLMPVFLLFGERSMKGMLKSIGIYFTRIMGTE